MESNSQGRLSLDCDIVQMENSLSTQPNEVITLGQTLETVAHKPTLRPHLIQSGQHTALEATSHEFTAGAVPLDAFTAPWAPARVRETPARPSIRPTRHRIAYGAAKRALDITGALTIGAVFSPLILAIVVRMRMHGGPILFRHRRVGLGGKVFQCLKFRTMVPDAERILRDLLAQDPQARAEWEHDHKLQNDPRITRLGRFLRKTSLDELPQLWNVLRGEMSLVGPRPIVREEMLRYGRYLPSYLASKPGITGLWQVTGRNDTGYRRRVALDTYYVRKQTLLMDLQILFKTVKVVISGRGAY